MRIAVLRETFTGECRVAATPSAVRTLVAAGHAVLVEQNAGAASGFSDDAYIMAGAEIAPTAEECFDRGAFIWKVLRPSAHERTLLRAGHVVFACMHQGPSLPDGVEVIAAERHPPVLAAMSDIAGRLAVETAAHVLQRQHGGRGLFLGGVPGVEPASVAIIGAGTAGRAAAAVAASMGADVVTLDTDVSALRAMGRTLHATAHNVERALIRADLVVAAVRDASGVAPRVATRAHLAVMQPGAVVVDLSINDGGAFESTPLTTLDDPAAVVDGIVHVGVPNLCGGVPRTASIALSQAALGFVLARVGPA